MTRDERELVEVEGYVKGLGVNRKALATKLDCDPSLLSKIFNGVHRPGLLWFVRLGEVLRDMQDVISPPRFDTLARV